MRRNLLGEVVLLVLVNSIFAGIAWFISAAGNDAWGDFSEIGADVLRSDLVVLVFCGIALWRLRHLSIAGALVLLAITFFGGGVLYNFLMQFGSAGVSGILDTFPDLTTGLEYVRNTVAESWAYLAYRPWAYLDWLVSVFLVFELRSRPRFEDAKEDSAPGYRGPANLDRLTNVTRLLLLNLAVHGSSLRRWVLVNIAHRHLAIAPYPGLDVALVAKACAGLERREVRYEIIAIIALIAALAACVFDQMLLAFAILAAYGLVHLQKEIWLYRRWALPLLKGHEPATLLATVKFDANHAVLRRLEAANPNLILYRGFDPFENFGAEISGFTSAIDLSRTRDDWPDGSPPEAFTIEELYEGTFSRIAALNIPGVALFDRVFMNGEDVTVEGRGNQLPDLLQSINPESVHQAYVARRGDARAYTQIQLTDWSGDLVISYFFRFTRMGSILTIEAIGRMLTPLNAGLRLADETRQPHALQWVGWYAKRLALSPADLPIAVIRLCARIAARLGAMLGLEARVIRSQLRSGQRFDFGAPPTLRRRFMSDSYVHAFMKSDKLTFTSFVQGAVLEYLADFLDARGVNIANLREQQTTIMNSGIIVHGGDVHAQALAIGEGSSAKAAAAPIARDAKPPRLATGKN